MSKQYDDLNRGVLFINTKKKSDKSPDFNGRITLADGEHYLSAWKAVSSTGIRYIQLSIGTLVGPQTGEKAPKRAVKDQDDLPF
jgi:uncharacterized protein (DUF736 family)